MRVSVVGSGYVGLVSSAGFAEKGHEVVCVDIDEGKVKSINNKIPPIYEDGLAEILNSVVPERLKASTDLKNAVLNSEVTFICVGTPSAENGEIDLSQVEAVASSLGGILKEKDDYHVVVVKSTVSAGSTEKVVLPILEEKSGKKAGESFGVCMNPEFLREGVAVEDFLNPDRIVIGAIDERAGDLVESLYRDFTSPVLRTNLNTAEMIKYASNSLLATKISFVNEVGNVCKKLGIDVYDVAKGIGLDHRISPSFLNAGPGFGGSCFPKDVSALVEQAKSVDVEPTLLSSVLEVNKKQPLKFVDLVKSKMSLEGKKIAVLGLAFKAGTDDMRESPTIPIINSILLEGATVTAYDPEALENAKEIFSDKIAYADSVEKTLSGADACLVLTEWPEFKKADFSVMKTKIVFDSRKIINKDLLSPDVEYVGLCW